MCPVEQNLSYDAVSLIAFDLFWRLHTFSDSTKTSVVPAHSRPFWEILPKSPLKSGTTRDPNSIYVKRVVGLEGDIVTTLGYRKRSVLVPAGHCWLEGDNHLASDDSNKFGPIPMGLITARATHVIYPVTRWQHLPRKFPHSRVKINPGCNDDQVWDLEQV
ncbi:unnamed protein product [Clavelina lepadiformis]|uniref:Mitochondrial inner membrane protease subunit 2 n=1 Tax=Clavelina lepadiformis TaxID=159417 RepID=A0ABP0FT79_CLALP